MSDETLKLLASTLAQLDEARAELTSAHGLGAAMMAERDEARAELAEVREDLHYANLDNNSNAELAVKLDQQLQEARAELAKHVVALESHWKMWADCCIERDALRAAVEKHNDFVEYVRLHNRDANEQLSDFLIPLPPSAAPAASEPKP